MLPSSPLSKGKEKDAENKKISVSSFLSTKMFFAFLLIFLSFSFIILNPVNAGFFSFGGSSNDNNGETQTGNSQTMALLKPILNSISPSALGGGDITIVGQNSLSAAIGPLGSIADIQDKNFQEKISIYVVQKGDSISQIAKMFNVSVNTILWANNISSGEELKEGQTLIILPVSGIRYEVKEGDTLEGIAKKLKGDVGEILQFNDVSTNKKLVVGTIIIVPSGESSPSVSSSQPTSKPKSVQAPSYSGYYLRPISGGRRSQGIHGYGAVDLANSCGTSIVASASGDVIASRIGGWNGGYGNLAIIDHSNGTQTLYAHMNTVIVGTGWHVVQGQIIGYIGLTGNTTGCHLHFEIRGARNPF